MKTTNPWPKRLSCIWKTLAIHWIILPTVYPLCITYTGFHGLRGGRAERSALAWYGDTELAPHLQAMINSGAIDVELAWGEPIRMGRKLSRKEATRLAEISIRRARQEAVTGRSRG